MHKVEPTTAELQLIKAIAKPIQQLNRLSQISILQALTSSPQALMAQLNNMARNGTVPQELASTVRTIVTGMSTSAKLGGLGALIDKLKRENSERWRLVVFTIRVETQTTIQLFLESKGLKVGIINGSSGQRNQDTLARFRSDPPECHVIVSTEAGSEGVNLQVANVLVNYDLPWNPMIVEQRIGRVQRLGGEHKSVAIFNIMLRGTFEEYIVGRLMEKLQMASHAIGDIEALLGASGIGDEEENGETSFDERIRELVIAALAGIDVEAKTRQAELSIAKAKSTLEIEEKNINTMLGGMDGAEYIGPRAPTLPVIIHRMDSAEFVLNALKSFGARITPQSFGTYLVEENGGREYIRFEQNGELTGLSIHVEFATSNGTCIRALTDLLIGVRRSADESQLWEAVATQVALTLKTGRCRVEAAVLSPNGNHLAICCEVRTLLGLRVHQAGLVYSITEHCPVGRVIEGRRSSDGWSSLKS